MKSRTQQRRLKHNWRRGMTRIALVCVLLALPGLPACTKTGDAFDVYLDRLSRTLSVEIVPVIPSALAPLPAVRELRVDIAASDIDVLDFLALSGCDLQVTIGKRNSSLGRLARDSQRLLLELEYLQLAPACIDYLQRQGKTELAATLQQAWTQKRAQLPALIFNATLGGEEFRQFWKAPRQLDDYPSDTSSALIESLGALNDNARRWLAGDFTADNLSFELLLADMGGGDGGALRRALAEQAGALASANTMLDARMQRGPLCTPPLRPAAVDVLDNVIRKFFVAGTQPRAAALNRRYHDLLPQIRELEQLLGEALPPAYRDWQQQRDRELNEMSMAPRAHVEALQAIQKPCKQGNN